jgi:uncharacterized protein YndB with AHSA1/START domain
MKMTDLKLSVIKTINAPISTVFDAWLDAEMLAKFILPMPGMENPVVENDPCLGGKFTIMMRVGDNEIPHTGEYLTIDRPNKLVFSWVSPFSIEGSTVTLNLSEISDKSTRVELTHIKFTDEERRSNHEEGWTNILESLSNVIV